MLGVGGRLYDSKAIVGMAFGFKHPALAAGSDDSSGGVGTGGGLASSTTRLRDRGDTAPESAVSPHMTIVIGGNT
jgi:hypothetical protein